MPSSTHPRKGAHFLNDNSCGRWQMLEHYRYKRRGREAWLQQPQRFARAGYYLTRRAQASQQRCLKRHHQISAVPRLARHRISPPATRAINRISEKLRSPIQTAVLFQPESACRRRSSGVGKNTTLGFRLPASGSPCSPQSSPFLLQHHGHRDLLSG